METSQELKERLVSELGIGNLATEAQEKILVSLSESVMKRTLMATFSRLTAEDQHSLDAIIEKENFDELMAFLRTKVSDLDHIMSSKSNEIVAEYKQKREELRPKT